MKKLIFILLLLLLHIHTKAQISKYRATKTIMEFMNEIPVTRDNLSILVVVDETKRRVKIFADKELAIDMTTFKDKQIGTDSTVFFTWNGIDNSGKDCELGLIAFPRDKYKYIAAVYVQYKDCKIQYLLEDNN